MNTRTAKRKPQTFTMREIRKAWNEAIANRARFFAQLRRIAKERKSRGRKK